MVDRFVQTEIALDTSRRYRFIEIRQSINFRTRLKNNLFSFSVLSKGRVSCSAKSKHTYLNSEMIKLESKN